MEDLHFVSICGVRRARPPIVPYLCSFRRRLEPGRMYRFCTCGRSEEQPWCDDSHLSTDPQPIEFSIDPSKAQTMHQLCGCKYSTAMPFCDGSHVFVVDGYEEAQQQQQQKADADADAALPAGASTSAVSEQQR